MIFLIVSEQPELCVSFAEKKANELGQVTRVPETWDPETFLIRLSSPQLTGETSTFLLLDRDIFEGTPSIADRLHEVITENKLCHHAVVGVPKAKKHPLLKTLEQENAVYKLDASRRKGSSLVARELLESALKESGATMDSEAQRELLFRVGDNPLRIRQEITKLSAFADGRCLRRSHVISLVTDDSLEDFGLQDAVRKRDAGELTRQVQRLIHHGTAVQAIFVQIVREIRRLLILSSVVKASERGMVRGTFLKKLHPSLMERKEKIQSLDESLVRNWKNPYYMYYLYAALEKYSEQDLKTILVRLGMIHRETRKDLSPSDLAMATISLLGGPHAQRGR